MACLDSTAGVQRFRPVITNLESSKEVIGSIRQKEFQNAMQKFNFFFLTYGKTSRVTESLNVFALDKAKRAVEGGNASEGSGISDFK